MENVEILILIEARFGFESDLELDQFWDWASFGVGPVLGWASFGVGPVLGLGQFWLGQFWVRPVLGWASFYQPVMGRPVMSGPVLGCNQNVNTSKCKI